MATRSKGEIAKIERRMRIERTVLPVLCVLGVAVFVVLCAVFGKKRGGEEEEIAPTPAPYSYAILSLRDSLGGDITNGDKFTSLTYKSNSDGRYASVNAYLKSGVLCMSVTHPFEVKKAEPTAEPTEDIFGGSVSTSSVPTEEPEDRYLTMLADELTLCFSKVYVPSGDDDASERIGAALISLKDGAKKANVIYGIYMLKFERLESDGLLTVTCEPA